MGLASGSGTGYITKGSRRMLQHLENLTELIFHPYVVALISLFIGCYLLGDNMRVILYTFFLEPAVPTNI